MMQLVVLLIQFPCAQCMRKDVILASRGFTRLDPGVRMLDEDR